MKIKNGFVVREIAGECVVVALGEASKIFNGIIKLNPTARIMWDMLAKGSDKDAVVDAILNDYEVDRETVECDFDRFVEKLKGANILE